MRGVTGLDFYGRRRELLGFSFSSGLRYVGVDSDSVETPHGGYTTNIPKVGSSLVDAPAIEAVRAGRAALKRGMRGDAVRWLQRALSLYGVVDDGVFASETEAAVRKFQGERGLSPDGIVGKDTVAAIEGGALAKRDAPASGGGGSAMAHVSSAAPTPPLAKSDKPTNWLAWGATAAALGLAGFGGWTWWRGA